MADVHGSSRVTDSAGATAPGGQESSSAQERREQVQEIGKQMSHKAQELTEQGKEVAAEYYHEGRERVMAWQQQLEHQVREKPIQSLLIAAGIGLLIGLFKRR
jgi:ElaB/YqjD/DUF883 family membrane-anchored ribosome-binding protein